MKQKLVLAILLLVICTSIYAYTQSSFSDGTTTGNLTFTAGMSLYKNISIPYWASVTGAKINLRGYNPLYIFDDTKTGYNCTANVSNCNYAVDINWETSANISVFRKGPGVPENLNSNITINFTVGLNVKNYTNVSYISKYQLGCAAFAANSVDFETYCLNTSGQYNLIFVDTASSETKPITTQTIYLPSNCFRNDSISIVHDILTYSSSDTVPAFANYYEGRLNYTLIYPNTNYIQNLSVKSNNNLIYQNLSNFTGTVSNIDLNKTSLQTCINTAGATSGNVNCTINFTSSTAGILEYSNLDIDYSVFLNITFRDELTHNLISGESISILLKNSSWENTYTTNESSYKIDSISPNYYNIEITSSSYNKKVFDHYYIGESLNYLTAYLINSSLSTEVTFHVVDKYGVDIQESLINCTRYINGSFAKIFEQYTDVNGVVVANMDENYEYSCTISKSGYDTKYMTVDPLTSVSYTIGLMQSIASYDHSVYEGFTYSFSPSNTVLNNNTNYNFTFLLNSSYWALTSCNLYLYNGTLLINQNSGYNALGCYLNVSYNTGTMSGLTLTAVYTTNSSSNFTHSQPYTIKSTYQGDFSFKTFLDDLTNFGDAGFDDFGRFIIALIVMMALTASLAQYIGWDNKEALVILVVLEVWFFSYIDWLHINYASIPTEFLKQYFLAILVSLAGGAYLLERYNK